MLSEQGYLCAYTGRRIDADSSHVEHLKPQTACKGTKDDIEYRNMVACFPADGGDVSHGYGAPVKGGWWDESLFISPLCDECERRFRFSWSGHIYPHPQDDAQAATTINKIGLDTESLRKLREARIKGFFGIGVRTRHLALSKRDAEQFLGAIDRPNSQQRLQEFCFVLKQLLPKYIKGTTS